MVISRLKHTLRFGLLLSTLVVTLAPFPAFATVSVSDDGGAVVSLPGPAKRVISLAPHTTELLYAAGGGDTLVGAVEYSDYPPAARAVPRIGDNKSLDLERIIALKPDLILVWRHGNAQRQLDRLRELGVPMFFSDPQKLDQVAATVQKFGTLLGTGAVAEPAASRFRSRIAKLRATYATRPSVAVFYQVWDDPLMTLNGTSIISDVISLCGGHNVFADSAPLVPTVSTEAVLNLNPEAIITAAPGATHPDRPLAGLERWARWSQLSAVAHHNLFLIDGDLINRPTPRLADGAALMCDDLEQARTRR
jgi:iron complex transport system substrate-binding protein